ncbi:hypothetical protein M413DRAFT_14372 [Hebeloma cylindrosporum]|uniref:T6SS Phospholipase effector Tle1-like catalytic domain-containing protein n=1 Tax=Hebeloma cylindrosporum TaxID=76867 RepID=A0A0C3BUQ2_HEBCY|nr:hypothetical protein M413DRAFT_14372 [Hebeloma cylindrosporum h7]
MHGKTLFVLFAIDALHPENIFNGHTSPRLFHARDRPELTHTKPPFPHFLSSMADPNIHGEQQRSTHATTGGVPNDDHLRRSDVPQPCGHGINSRNLIVCIDGTANQFGKKNTNVIELYKLILKEVENNQRTWYNSGIGTYARPSWKSFKFYRQVLEHKIDLAIAWNFERTILAAYRWLSDNYMPGDCIFLFGFSRGAYQVRVLSAMIDKVGLILKGNETQIPFAYELYSDPKSELDGMAERFKDTFSYKDVKVHFVGAWDTVSSIGIARSIDMLPRTIDGMKHVCYFRHALALDERRVKFLPEYAYGGKAKDTNASTTNYEPSDDIQHTDSDKAIAVRRMRPTGKRPHTKEVWFAGTHSDIGGGNVDNPRMDRSRPPLRWMVFEAGALGLRTEPFERELARHEQIEIKESLTPLWWPLELFFFNRLTYTRREEGKHTTHKPHLGSPRKIHRGQNIHSSLMLSNQTTYTPKARPSDDDPRFWANARENGLGDWLELDLYDHTQTLVKRFITEGPGLALRTLHEIMMSVDGLQAVYDGVIKVLEDPKVQPEELMQGAIYIFGGRGARESTSLQLRNLSEVRALVSDIQERNQKLVQQFLGLFTDCE